MKPVIFKQAEDGRLLAVRNWRHRRHEDDVMVAEPLTGDQLAEFRKGRAEGLSEAAIFDRLFLTPVGETVALPLEALTRDQIRHVLERLGGAPMPSLQRCSRADLLALLRTVRATSRDPSAGGG